MTIQNLFIADLTDIFRIQIECKCGAQFSYDPDKEIRIPFDCPQCAARWNHPHHPSHALKVIEAFMTEISRAREQERTEGQIKLRLVFDRTVSAQE